MKFKIDIRVFLQKYQDVGYDDALWSFVTFMIDNDWFQTNPEIQSINNVQTLLFSEDELKLFEANLDFFIRNQNLNQSQKFLLLQDSLKSKFPETALSIGSYLCEDTNDNVKLSIYNFLLKFQEKEICDYSNKEIDALIKTMCDEIPLSAGRQFTDYLNLLRKQHKTAFSNDFILESRNSESRVKEAYSSETYLKLAYYLFNQEYIEDQDMIVNSCENWQSANTWLYLAIHMICALRDTDVVSLPGPRLTKEPAEVIKSIKDGTFSDAEARACALSVMRQLSFFRNQPNKTKGTANVPDIKLYFPESAQALFGTLLALAEAHRRLSDNTDRPLIKPVRDYERICRYMGDDIGYLFLEDNFSTRSANKAYMQAVELFADDILNESGNLTHAKGYMLAALARSHKGSYGEFTHTSEIYLKDANFSGYSPKFIAKELFERGVCAFIPAMLLEIITDGEYKTLPIQSQTKLIQEVGLTAANTESLVGIVNDSMHHAADTAKQIIQSFQEPTDDTQGVILHILQNIASGGAVSKQDDSLCLMTAMGQGCKRPDSCQCIGCEYEISTKSTIYLLMSEYNRLQLLKGKAESPQLKGKYIGILKEVIVPKISDILICMQKNYGDESIREIESIIQEMQNGR